MGFLKSLALSLLSFLLFLSLSIFGMALMVQSTLLKPDFVVAELNRLDVADLAGEIIKFETPEGEPDRDMEAMYTGVVNDLEPLVKEQLSATIYSIYDYLLGKKPDPELKPTLKNTFLSEDFLVAVIDRLDTKALIGTYLKEQLTGNLPAELAFLNEYLEKNIDKVVSELKPWLQEEVRKAAGPLADYLLGDSPNLDVVISLEPVKEILREKLLSSLMESPPPELASLPPASVESAFDMYWDTFAQEIPTSYRIDESILGADLPAQIETALTGVETALLQARQYVGYFQITYRVLIGLMALFVLGVILVSRQVKYVTRHLGISCLAYGAMEYAGIYFGKPLAAAQIGQQEIPPGLQIWLVQLLDNLMAPLLTFSLVLMVAGIVLVVVSFIYRPGPD